MPFRNHYEKRKIPEINPDVDLKVKILGFVVDKKDDTIVLDDGSEKVKVFVDTPGMMEKIKINQLIRVFGSTLPTEDGFEIRADSVQDLSNLNINLPFKVKNAPNRKGYSGLFLYGMLYSLVSVSCVIPLFVGVMLRAINSSSIFEGILVFFAYSFGLALLLILITILVSGEKITIIKKINKMLPLIQKIGSFILIIVGIWLIYNYLQIII